MPSTRDSPAPSEDAAGRAACATGTAMSMSSSSRVERVPQLRHVVAVSSRDVNKRAHGTAVGPGPAAGADAADAAAGAAGESSEKSDRAFV